MLTFYYYNRILILAAIIPAIFLLIKVYQLDTLEKESPSLLLSLVFSGILATFISLLLEQIGDTILSSIITKNTLLYNFIFYFLVVGLVEEGSKYFLLKKKTWNNYQFNCQFDGIVYAIFVSLGFALFENISYVLMYGFNTALIRAITAIPGHACFGVFMGIFYGIARKYANNNQLAKAKTYRTLALFIPTIIHGSYDFIASFPNGQSHWFIGFIFILFIITYNLIKKSANNDRYI